MTTFLPDAAAGTSRTTSTLGPASGPSVWDDLRWEITTVRHVSAAAGADLTGRSGPIWSLVLRGSIDLATAGGSRSLRAGDAVLVSAATAHRLIATGESEVALADLCPVLPANALPSPLVVTDFSGRHPGVAALIDMCPLRDACPSSAFVASYGDLIGAAMVTSWLEDTDRADGPPGGADPVVADVMAELMRRPGEPWTIEEMARLAHLSRSALAERFRRALGRSPTEVLRDVRMLVARKLLRDPGRTVT